MDQREILQLLKTALAQHQAGRAADAEAIYRRVLVAAPEQPDALHLLGVIEAQRGNVVEAIELLRRAVARAPQMAEFHRHLGEVLAMANQHAEAVNHFGNALRIDPRDVAARSAAGSSLLALNRPNDAVEQFKAVAQLKPTDAAAVGNYGYALSRAGRHADAVAALRRATEINPNFANAWVQLAEAIWRGGDWDAAPAVARHGVSLNPNDARAWLVLGNTLQTSGDLEEAAQSYRRVLEIDPNSIDAQSNLALTLLKLGEAQEALSRYEQIMSRWPNFNDARANRSLAMLTLGDFERGWQEYEARWSSPQFMTNRPSGMPRWKGEEIRGKTLVLVSEQGFGDTIQFVRYASMVRQRSGAAKVIVACPADLVAVVQTVRGIDQVVPNGSAVAHDLHAPLASLPGIFNTRLDTIPADVPYMSADPARVERWKQRFAGDTNVKVGLVWAGSASHQNDRARSCRLADFAPLAGVGGVTLCSLQKGSQASQLAGAPAEMKIIPLGDELRDFADTAAALVCLDLLVSVDTSVVHLAGALGRTVWTLLARGPDFRWMLRREDSPWYPTMRLFRQERIRQWQPVIDRIAAELTTFVEQKKE